MKSLFIGYIQLIPTHLKAVNGKLQAGFNVSIPKDFDRNKTYKIELILKEVKNETSTRQND